MEEIKLRHKAVAGVAVALAFIALVWQAWPKTNFSTETRRALADCLSEKGAVMYGSKSCVHCQAQKRLFGSAFEKISYVECPENIQTCQDAEITGYPTWILGDGTRLAGEQTLDRIAEASGCVIQKEN